MEIEEYKISKIPKGKNSFRLLYIPTPTLKKKLQSHLSYLQYKNLELDEHRTCHAFLKGRNCVTNALQHVGYNYCVSMDIKDFFDSVRPHHVENKVSREVIQDCFIDGAPRQGLPTSPLLSNLALLDADAKIIEFLNQFRVVHRYTRYADDISISFDDERATGRIIFIVNSVLESYGFSVNQKKTKIQSKENGRIIITGIAIDKNGLFPTRKTKRKIRAAYHQKNISSVRGLEEWAKCKLPNNTPKNPKRFIRIVGKTLVSCMHCNQSNLIWAEQYPGRTFLVNSESGSRHKCKFLNAILSQRDLMTQLKKWGTRTSFL
ncbi:MAG: RNA-directed DNA polymerase [Hahellaceae bacterium]|nr:RNA-directed DNA polymerase [Hahellaceae bacterium]